MFDAKIVSRISLEEKYIDDEYETVTLYLTVPVDAARAMGINCPNAKSVCISIEYPESCNEAKEARVMAASTIETEDGLSDDDWRDLDLPYEEIEQLMAVADSCATL